MSDGFDTPVEVFQQAVDALDREDFLAVARLCDPASLSLFKRHLLQQFAPQQNAWVPTVEWYLRNQPDMPREVAEYNVASHLRHMGESRRIDREVARVESYEALETLASDEAFARWLEARSPREQLRRYADSHAIAGEQADRALNDFAHLPFRVRALGAVERGHVAYVVYTLDSREALDSDPTREAYLASLTDEERDFVGDVANGPIQPAPARRQPDGTWRLVADHDFMGSGSMMVGFALDSGSDGDQEAAQPTPTM